MSVGTVVRVGIIYEERQLDLQSPSSSVVPLRQTREFSLLRDLPQGTAQFVAPLVSEPPPYWRSLWCNSDGFFYTISLKETTVAHRTFTTPDYMLCVSCLIILFLSQGWVMFSHLLFRCLAYKAEILKGDCDPSVEDWMMTSKREVSMGWTGPNQEQFGLYLGGFKLVPGSFSTDFACWAFAGFALTGPLILDGKIHCHYHSVYGISRALGACLGDVAQEDPTSSQISTNWRLHLQAVRVARLQGNARRALTHGIWQISFSGISRLTGRLWDLCLSCIKSQLRALAA